MKKPRSTISQSPQEIRDQVIAAFDAGKTLQEVAELFGELTGVKISHKAAASFYHGDYQQHADKIRAARAFALQLSGAAGDGKELKEGFNAALQQKAFEIMANPTASSEDVNAIGNLLLTLQRTQNDSARVDLDKQKQLTREKVLELSQQRVDLEIKKYRDKVEEQKREISKTIDAGKKSGGLTKETLETIEQQLRLL